MTAFDPYYNRGVIPDFDAIMAETAARSAALARTWHSETDIPYGNTPRQRFDLFLPPGLRTGAPLHMFIHGGYWRAGSRTDHHLVATPVLAAGGIAAIIGYDLMPGTRLGAIVAQVRAAAHAVQTRAAALGADPARFTVSGHSAGAHLASLLSAQAPGDDNPPALPALRGLLLVSGIYDLSGIPDSFLRTEAQMTLDEATAWSPLSARHLPGPLRIVTRGADETAPFHDQATALCALLDTAGQPADLRLEPGHNHLTVVLDLADIDRPLGRRLADLVAQS